jgi:2-polyprenyl-3-methyl-5-hydroxy-6-metoxy-1,4-benzoquinol methylase
MIDDQLERARVRDFYDQQAARNPRHAAVLGEPSDFATAYREFQELRSFRAIVPLDPQTRLIEFGSGGGRWLDALAPLVSQAVGVELSPRCVDLSRQRLKAHRNVAVDHSDIEDYEPTGEFDLFFYSGVLLYLSDRALITCLRKHLSHLSADGKIVIRDSLSLGASHPLRHPDGYAAMYRSISDWQSMLAELGLVLRSRKIANQRPLSDRTKQSRLLQAADRVARRLSCHEFFLRSVAKLYGHDASLADEDPQYSHEFLLCRRIASPPQC